MSSGYVCSIGPHGFYGYVSIGDATNDAIPIEVSVTYDHRVNLNNDLTERFDVPLRASGEMSFPNEWLAVWSWKDPQKAVAEQNAEPELPITGF